MKNSTRWMTAGVVAALLMMPIAARAAEERAEMGKDDVIQQFKAELKLTPDQDQKLRAIRTQSKEQFKAIREKLMARREALRKEMEKPAVDKAAVNSIVADVKALMGEQLDARITGMLAVKEILTPEQQKILQQKMEERRAKMKEHWGKMREHREHMKE